MKQVNKTTEEARYRMLRASAQALPNSPSLDGMSATEIKRALWSPMLGTENSLLAEEGRIVDEVNEALSEVDGEVKENAEHIGDVSALKTVSKNLVGAINEERDAIDRMDADMGDVSALKTASKVLVDAINEEKDAIEENRGAIDENRGAIEENRDAIEENRSVIEENRANIGEVSALKTNAKILVEAINENKENHDTYKYTVAAGHGLLQDQINQSKADIESHDSRLTNLSTQLSGNSRSYVVDDFHAFLDILNFKSEIFAGQLITGDNVLIVEHGVPDFWYEKTEDGSRAEKYTYEGVEYTLAIEILGKTYGVFHVLESDYTVIEGYSKSASAAALESENFADESEGFAKESEEFAKEAEAAKTASEGFAKDAERSAENASESAESAESSATAAESSATAAESSAAAASQSAADARASAENVSAAISGKVDKLNNTTGSEAAYVQRTDNTVMLRNIADGPAPTTIPRRTGTGAIRTATPTEANHSVNLQYLTDHYGTHEERLTTVEKLLGVKETEFVTVEGANEVITVPEGALPFAQILEIHGYVTNQGDDIRYNYPIQIVTDSGEVVFDTPASLTDFGLQGNYIFFEDGRAYYKQGVRMVYQSYPEDGEIYVDSIKDSNWTIYSLAAPIVTDISDRLDHDGSINVAGCKYLTVVPKYTKEWASESQFNWTMPVTKFVFET